MVYVPIVTVETGKKQRGVVLVLGLIFMAIVSGLTISSINNSTLIEEISFNTQETAYVKQGSENAAAISLSNGTWVNKSLRIMDDPSSPEFPSYDISFESDQNLSATSKLSSYRELVPGYTIDVESDISFIRMEIESDSELSSVEIDSKMTYGYMRLGAGG